MPYLSEHTSSKPMRLNYLGIIVLMIFSLNSAMASGLDNLLKKGTSFDTHQPDFLKVDEAFQFQSEVMPNGFKLKWIVEPGYYLYLERFKFKANHDSTLLGEAEFSTKGDPKEDPYFGLVHAIHDDVTVFIPVELGKDMTEDEINISYQGCAEAGLCYPPKKQTLLFTRHAKSPETNPAANSNAATNTNAATNIDILSGGGNSDNPNKIATQETLKQTEIQNLEDASGVFNFISNSSLPLIVGIFFLLGLGLTFTPCVFPMIPIITSIIAGQQKPTTRKSFVLALTYVLGMALTYSAAGVITGLLGAGANIQAALQSPYILSFFAGIFILLSLAMFGLYELQLPAFIRDKLNNTSQNLSGGHISSVFMIGALSALVVSPCVSAPLAGALLYISSTADAVIGGLSLFALGLGMGVPLIIIAVSGSKLMPKAGQWMNQVKNVFGVMLLAVAIWLLSRTIPAEISMILWALLIGLSATQMGAFEAAKPGWSRLFKGLGLILAFYSAMLIIGALTGAQDPLKPLAKFTQTKTIGTSQTSLTPVKFNIIYDEEGLEKERLIASNLNKPMLVDFYADWCISCIVMENTVFPLPEIKSKLEQFHLVKADVTENSEANQSLLDKFGLFGPPSILLFDTKGKENKALRIVGEINKSAFENRLIEGLKI